MAKGPRSESGRSAYERYYTAKAEEQEAKNRARRGETLLVADAEARWGRIATEWATAAQNLTSVAVQRGLITAEKEAAHRALVDELLLERMARGAEPAKRPRAKRRSN